MLYIQYSGFKIFKISQLFTFSTILNGEVYFEQGTDLHPTFKLWPSVKVGIKSTTCLYFNEWHHIELEILTDFLKFGSILHESHISTEYVWGPQVTGCTVCTQPNSTSPSSQQACMQTHLTANLIDIFQHSIEGYIDITWNQRDSLLHFKANILPALGINTSTGANNI